MRINFGEIFQQKSKDRTMGGTVNVPIDNSLWPKSWKTVQYKTYDRFKRIDLPKPCPKSFGHEELLTRRSFRDFNQAASIKKPIDLEQISNILYFSCGETQKNIGGNNKRVQGSGGGRYPIEVYLLNFVEGDLGTKCYHYNVKDHCLEELWDIGILKKSDISTFFAYPWSQDVACAVVLTGVPFRTCMKYGERGYRYMYLEAGAILNNIQNNATLEDVKSVIMGGTNEKQIEELLDLDGIQETVILSVLLGH